MYFLKISILLFFLTGYCLPSDDMEIMFAIAEDKLTEIQEIIKKYPDKNNFFKTKLLNGQTPFDYALSVDSENIAPYFYGLYLASPESERKNFFENEDDTSLRYPLFIALTHKHHKLLSMMLKLTPQLSLDDLKYLEESARIQDNPEGLSIINNYLLDLTLSNLASQLSVLAPIITAQKNSKG